MYISGNRVSKNCISGGPHVLLFLAAFFYQKTHLRLPLPLIKLRYGSVWPQGDLTHFVVQYNVDPAPTHHQRIYGFFFSIHIF